MNDLPGQKRDAQPQVRSHWRRLFLSLLHTWAIDSCTIAYVFSYSSGQYQKHRNCLNRVHVSRLSSACGIVGMLLHPLDVHYFKTLSPKIASLITPILLSVAMLCNVSGMPFSSSLGISTDDISTNFVLTGAMGIGVVSPIGDCV